MPIHPSGGLAGERAGARSRDPLPLPSNAVSHTVTLDEAGNVWYTGNKNGTVGKLDPKSGEVTVYKMPDAAAKDSHTAVFDRSGGTLWFTLPISNMVGKSNFGSTTERATAGTAVFSPVVLTREVFRPNALVARSF